MSKINFINGSEIESFASDSNIRGSRSKLISFYCVSCGCVHEDCLIKDMIIIDDDIWMCRESYTKVILPLFNSEE